MSGATDATTTGSDCRLHSPCGIVVDQMSVDADIRAAAFSWLAEQAARHGHVVRGPVPRVHRREVAGDARRR